MRFKFTLPVATLAALSAAALGFADRSFTKPLITSVHAQTIDWQKVDDTLGRKPAVAGNVRRYGFACSDLKVRLDGVKIKPALTLGGWLAFKPMSGEAMVMGDLVVLETEVRPVMMKMIQSGLEITAVHNHLLRASPETFYMHVVGRGDPVKLARAIHDALAMSNTPLKASPRGCAARRRSRHRAT